MNNEIKESVKKEFFAEEYESKKDVPSSLKNLSLKQANYWAKVYDAVLGKQSEEDSSAKAKSARIAWSQTNKKFNL